MHRRETDYFRIGVFVILGLVLLIIAILLFTSSHIFKKELYVETYFNESVQGLTEGSKVKYRGINIGYVKSIRFIPEVYALAPEDENSQYSRYIYVRIAINPYFIPGVSVADLKKLLEKDVQEGLRIKMSMTGLTGSAYLELNFSNAKQNPPLPIKWKPKYIYIPSETSTLTRIGDSVQKILNGLQDVNFPILFQNIQSLVQRSDNLVTTMNGLLQRTQGDIAVTLHNTKVISTTMRNNPSSLLFARPQQINPRSL